MSVVVPCYNYGRFLGECVRSILTQPGVDVAVLVIDDASTDRSHATALRLAAGDSRVEVRRHDTNRGHIATYNEGLEWADGDYVVLLSADDMLAPGALERAASVFAAHPGVGMVYGQTICFEDGRPLPPPRVSSAFHRWDGHSWIRSRCRLGRVWVLSPEVILRTELQHAIGGYRADLPHSGDSEMWLRAAAHADVAFVAADQAYHRVHPASMSQSEYAALAVDVTQRQAAFSAALLHPEHRLADSRSLHATAMQGLAADVLWEQCRSYGRGCVDDGVTDRLVQLALGLHHGARHLPEYRALQWRRRLGPGMTRRVQALALPAMARRRIRRRRTQYGPLWWRYL